jgi:O-antigen ligase
MLGLASIAGLLTATIVILWPLVGLGLLIFAGTSFQILGSSHITGLPISLPKVFGMLTLVSWFLWAVRRRSPLTFSPQLIPCMFFIAVVLLSVMIMPDREQSLLGLFKLSQVFLLYLLVMNLAIDRKSLLIVCMLVSATAVVASCIGMLEYFLPQFEISADDPRLAEGTLGAILDLESGSGVIKRVTGGLGDANWFSYTMASILPLSLFWWRNFPRLGTRLLILIVSAIQMVGLVLSYTRTGLFGFGVAILYLTVKRRLPVIPTLTMGAAVLLVAVLWLPPVFWERMFSWQYLRQGSTSLRIDLVRGAWQLIMERPLFGYGYGQFGPEYIKHLSNDVRFPVGAWGANLEQEVAAGRENVHNIGAHNMYLEVGVEYGLLGLLPFVTFLVWILKDLTVVERHGDRLEQDLAVSLYACLIAFYTCGLLGHAKTLKILWILAGLTAALRRVVFTERVVEPSPSLAPLRW